MTLKEIIDSVLLESGVGSETVYAASTDDAVKRLVNLVNRSAAVLSRYSWQALRATHEFTLSTATEYSLPADYKAIIPDTFYTEDRLWGVDFPASQTEWAYLQASTGGSGYRERVRLIGDKLHFYEPNSGVAVRFEYLSKYPVADSDSAKKAKFTADTDTWLLDDDLLIMDTLWRYKKLAGLEDWREDLVALKLYERTLKGQESGAQTLRPGPYGEGYFGPYYNDWRPTPNI